MQLALPENYPLLLLVDNVSSHSKEGLLSIGASSHLWCHLDFTNLYLMFGLPNLSHLTNPGDQSVNLSLRALIRRASKMRVVAHTLELARGQLPPGTRLEFSEAVVKPLLTLWVSQLIRDPIYPGGSKDRGMLF